MADLDRLRDVRLRLALGRAGPGDAGGDAALPRQRHGAARHRRAGAAQQGRPLPSLSGAHQRLRSVVSAKGAPMTATIAAEAAPSFSMRLLERDLVPDFL